MINYNFSMTYNEFVRECQKNSIPLADIRVVLDGYFNMPFDYLGIHGEEETSKDGKGIIEKLLSGYPANYLAGYIDILKTHLFLNEDTLIPRNETAQFLHEYLFNNHDLNNKKVLDLCTGSGFIAICTKKKFPNASMTASDIVDNALEIARKSAEYNNTEIKFIKSDFLKNITDSFDYIISNPPYIENNNSDVVAPYEPKLALYSGDDGLDSYRSIFKNLDSHLNSDGYAFFELESTNSKSTMDLFTKINPSGFEISIWKDLYNRDRYLLAHKVK